MAVECELVETIVHQVPRRKSLRLSHQRLSSVNSTNSCMNSYPMPPEWVRETLRAGVVIPAHPLSLDRNRRYDELRQRALTRYYRDAGVGGIAVGVHTTQFEIRDPEHGLYEPVLRAAVETLNEDATDTT